MMLFICNVSVFAQEELSLRDIPDEYLAEMGAFYNQCQGKPQMYQYYNCECLAAKYINQRIEKGPGASEGAILLSINTECIDASMAAGMYFEQCTKNTVHMPKNTLPEGYCRCFANTYAKLFEEYKIEPSSYNFTKVLSQASMSCKNPELARRLYGGTRPTPR